MHPNTKPIDCVILNIDNLFLYPSVAIRFPILAVNDENISVKKVIEVVCINR